MVGQKLKMWAVFACALLVVQCGGDESESSKVTLTANPESPIVITADSKNQQGSTISWPWFSFTLSVENNSENPLTIIAVKYTTYPAEPGGAPVEGGTASSDFNYSLVTGSLCTYVSFDVIEAGKSGNISATSAGSSCYPYSPVRFFASGLTKPKSGRNYRYRVVIELLGWFGTYNEQVSRLQKSITIITQ